MFSLELLARHAHPDFAADLEQQVQRYIACLDVRKLTRCGGHADEPELVELQQLHLLPDQIVVVVKIAFRDGDRRDCSGFCAGTSMTRHDCLQLSIDLSTGQAIWETADGVITGD